MYVYNFGSEFWRIEMYTWVQVYFQASNDL